MKRAAVLLALLALAVLPAHDVAPQTPPLVFHRATLYSPRVYPSLETEQIRCSVLNVGKGTLSATLELCDLEGVCFSPGTCAPLAPGHACSAAAQVDLRNHFCRIDLLSARTIDARASIQGTEAGETR